MRRCSSTPQMATANHWHGRTTTNPLDRRCRRGTVSNKQNMAPTTNSRTALHTALCGSLVMIATAATVTHGAALRAPATAVSSSTGMPDVLIDETATSISGISAGGFAAVQIHVSFSNAFVGVGVLAGGPFYCALDNIGTALTACMTNGNLIDADALAAITRNTALWEFADSPSNMASDHVWVLSARNDTVVSRTVVAKLEEYYINFLDNPNTQLKAVYGVNGEHSQLTASYGSPCAHLGSPFINNCDYDAAGELLQHIYQGSLTTPKTQKFSGTFYKFNQADFLDAPKWDVAFGLNPEGYVYVPKACDNAAKRCRLHVAMHGCEMTIPDIDLQYVQYGGYNPWADANDFVILYPQAHANSLNPKGCFDWWGYSGTAYASNIGTQTLAVKRMMDTLQKQQLQPNNSANWPSDGMVHFLPSKTGAVAVPNRVNT